MVNTQIVTYIWNGIHQGYLLNDLKKQLISQGYPEEEVHAAVDYIYATYYYSAQNDSDFQRAFTSYSAHQAEEPISNKLPLFFLGIGILVLLTAAVLLIFLNSNDPAPQPRQPQQVTPPVIPRANQTIQNTTNVNNISNRGNNNGNDNNNDDNIANNTDDTTPNESINIEPLDPAVQYTRRQLDLRAAEEAKINPEGALTVCSLHRTLEEKEFCISSIGEISKNADFCSMISTEKIKDDCYMKIVLDGGDGNLCTLIQNAYKRDNCNRFAQAYAKSQVEVVLPEITERNPEEALNYYAVSADFY